GFAAEEIVAPRCKPVEQHSGSRCHHDGSAVLPALLGGAARHVLDDRSSVLRHAPNGIAIYSRHDAPQGSAPGDLCHGGGLRRLPLAFPGPEAEPMGSDWRPCRPDLDDAQLVVCGVRQAAVARGGHRGRHRFAIAFRLGGLTLGNMGAGGASPGSVDHAGATGPYFPGDLWIGSSFRYLLLVVEAISALSAFHHQPDRSAHRAD